MNDYCYLSNRNVEIKEKYKIIDTYILNYIDKALNSRNPIGIDEIEGLSMMIRKTRKIYSVVLLMHKSLLVEFLVVANNQQKQLYPYLLNTPPAPLIVSEWRALLTITLPYRLLKKIDEFRIELSFALLSALTKA
ncbi:hypothetical protein UA32_12405 [Photobacterium angustum]|uniref:Uncharacterized protein n=1 Tax=Photobacterium angustum TaxID=661 RepID=A0ABX5H189_PHOAN|nr:hypothetical protein [Photobacterium angustum]KJG37749.1 hypothetical protein UA32_12405 [Photobacterium angustum]PSX07016.1 hypothetical protein C0W27_15720 [Photobacterium angustum]